VTDTDRTDYIDPARTACLCDVGGAGYVATVAVAADGSTRLVLTQADRIGDENARYDPTTPQAPHEQCGALPLEYVRRITLANRTRRCGRTTCKGRPCRIRVDRAGQACEFHRLATDTHD
jgi:hypothetical protein